MMEAKKRKISVAALKSDGQIGDRKHENHLNTEQLQNVEKNRNTEKT